MVLLVLLVLWGLAIYMNIQMAKTYGYGVGFCAIMGFFFGFMSTLIIGIIGITSGGNPNPLAGSPEDIQNKKDEKDLGFASRLYKLKSLLDEGIITQEEFEEKKKQILNAA